MTFCRGLKESKAGGNIFCRGGIKHLKNHEWVRTRVVVLSQSSCFPAHLRPRAATFGENQTVLQGDDDDDDDDHHHGDHDHDGYDICDNGSVSVVSFIKALKISLK